MAQNRQIALDTETTGKEDDGTVGSHRIIEIGCVEIIDREITSRTFQVYLNPEREIDAEATRVHGYTWDMLKDKPLFKDIAQEFIDFIRGSELLIHNAKFDTAFINQELKLMGYKEKLEDIATITDTIEKVRQINLEKQSRDPLPYSLNQLCSHFKIQNVRNQNGKNIHGALLDSALLAEVYLAMTGGQKSFTLQSETNQEIVNNWQRQQGMRLPIMQVEPKRHVVHVNSMIELSQKTKIGSENEQTIAGSHWGPMFNMPYLAQQDKEDKKAYKQRLQEQKNEVLHKLLSENDIALLQEMLDADKKAYQEWEDRVLGKAPKLPDPFPPPVRKKRK